MDSHYIMIVAGADPVITMQWLDQARNASGEGAPLLFNSKYKSLYEINFMEGRAR